MRRLAPSFGLWLPAVLFGSGCELIASPDASLLNGTGGGDATSTSTGPSTTTSASTSTSSSAQSSSSGSEGGGGESSTSQGGGGGDQGGSDQGGSDQGGSDQGGGGSGQGGGGGPTCVDPEVDCDDPPGECFAATCVGGVCDVTEVAPGTPTVLGQTDGDCQIVVCDGLGGTVSQDDDTDDGDVDTDCSVFRCVDGELAVDDVGDGEPCGDVGSGLQCLGGQCVGCVVPADCGDDTPCHRFTCSNDGVCGDDDVAAGTLVDDGIDENCQSLRCDGSGNGVAENDDDPPADVAGDCTTPICVDGASAADPLPAGSACSVSGGVECDDAGECVAFFCTTDADCDPGDTFCADAACDVGSGACFSTPRNEGAVDADAVDDPNDCQDRFCVGGVSTPGDADGETPTPDASPCTQEICSGGVPHPPVPTHDACIGGGGFCTAGQACVECTEDGPQCPSGDCDEGTNTCTAGAAPSVVSTVPAAGDADEDPLGTLAVTFSAAMRPATITSNADATSTACTGSIQLSEDDFATCIAIDVSLTAGDTVAVIEPAPALSFGRPYKIRVTTGAESAFGAPLASTFTLATAFTTEVDDVSEVGGGRQLVISQVYPGSGEASPAYERDFVELHNRGTTPYSVAGMSVQVAAAGSATWQVQPLSGTIPAGGYLLVALAAGGAGGAALPTPDVDGSIAMDTAGGKVVIKVNTTPSGVACPTGNGLVDLVGYGASPGCAEGSAAPAPSGSTALVRAGAGCADNDQNGADFTATTPSPRNGSSPASACVVRVLNESGIGREIDACTIENAVTVNGSAGSTASVSALVDEAGLTSSAGAGFGLAVQIGVGPRDTNPETEAGWTYTATSFLGQSGTADRWGLAAFTLPPAGTYGYAFRVSQDGGVSWTYCDADGAGTGANDFEITSVPTLISN